MQQGCSKMLEQLMNSKVQSDKKIDTNIKNNLQKDNQNQEVFAMLLSNQIINQKKSSELAEVNIEKKSSLLNHNMNTKDKNSNTKNELLNNHINTQSNNSFSKELISALDSKIDTLKNMQNKNQVLSEATKANMTMQNIFNELKTKKEFKDIRSVEELVKVANKSGLNIQNISIEQMQEAIKSTQDKKISINDLINTKTKELTKENIEKNKLESSKERLDTLKKVIDNNKQHQQSIVQESQSSLDKLSPHIGETTPRVDDKNALNNKAYKYNSFQELTEQIEAKQEKKSISSLTELLSKHKDLSTKHTDKQTDNLTKNINNEPNIKDVKSRNDKTDSKKDKEFSIDGLLKNSMSNDATEESKFSLNDLINNITSKDNERDLTNRFDDPIAALQKDIKVEVPTSNERQDIKLDSLSKAESSSEFSSKVADAKETVKKFVTDLEQKLQDYKPPLMKIELELKPLNLGSVDVTVVSRGSTLSIQLSSNSQALQMFLQNQDSFKNALSDIGFSDVKMDFNSNDGGSAGNSSSQQDGGSNSKESNKSRVKEYDYYTENEEIITDRHIDSIEITIPRYI
jgi:myosin heavy subunit